VHSSAIEHPVNEQDKQKQFEEQVMPHLDAAFNLARWMTRDEHDAQDIVQEAFLRAFKFFTGFRGTNSRAWLLSIVRNSAYTWLQKNRAKEVATVFDEELHGIDDTSDANLSALPSAVDHCLVRQAIEDLALEFREATILRELEGMSYKEIAEITQVPIGTVMSRLARARKQLQTKLSARLKHEGTL
jgi:RNA polymerase sigma-70 factor, ECF subfamily